MAHSVKPEHPEPQRLLFHMRQTLELPGVTTRRKNDSPSLRELRTASDDLIHASLESDPGRVADALEQVVERCKAQGRYPPDEIDAAAAQLRAEFGISRKVN